jgi:hypothetical protein
MVVHRFPTGKIVRQLSPLGAQFNQVQNGIDNPRQSTYANACTHCRAEGWAGNSVLSTPQLILIQIAWITRRLPQAGFDHGDSSDTLTNWRMVPTLKLTNEFLRKTLGLQVEISLPTTRAVPAFHKIKTYRQLTG